MPIAGRGVTGYCLTIPLSPGVLWVETVPKPLLLYLCARRPDRVMRATTGQGTGFGIKYPEGGSVYLPIVLLHLFAMRRFL
jgi:hypothetical protein